MWLKEVHVVVLIARKGQHLAQWQQKCYELHREFLYSHCHAT
jgi:hypothetical protein